MSKTFSQTCTSQHRDFPKSYPKQHPHHFLPYSGKPQNKVRNIICKSRITSTTPTASANWTSSESETNRSNRRYQSNKPRPVLKNYIAHPEILHEMHKQPKNSPSNNTYSERTR